MLKISFIVQPAVLLLISSMGYSQLKSTLIRKTPAYAWYTDRIIQGDFSAVALSPESLQSDYKSPANEFVSPEISFKFSINGKDNEMISGKDHHFTCIANTDFCEAPLIVFGTQLNDTRKSETYIKSDTRLKIRLDLRHVMEAFRKDGYYTSFNGDRIYKADFKGVYIAGNTAPLTWDFDNLVNYPELKLEDKDGDGIFEIILTLNRRVDKHETAAGWKVSRNLSAFPGYSSGSVLADALYKLSIEEMVNAVEPDSTLRTGKEWAGVWTRDISYSILLSMAHLQPRVAQYSLMRKVNKKKRIVQDTGTGGAWPVSSDRMIWAVAAWEIYVATGDKNWLKQAYEICSNSMEDDLKTLYDKNTGMVKGESSFLDWREQTYPKWMQPADIFESECLGTNAVHYQANIVLAKMADILGNKTAGIKYRGVASRIKTGVNKYLWVPGKNYYGQFLYGRTSKVLSTRSEALGEALSVLFDIPDAVQQKKIVENVPVTDYGISCIYPQIPNIPPYHNNAVWPFVQSFWLWAAAKTGNEEAVMESIAAIYRPAALFLTNKENFVADNGDFKGTQINSSNMLWSLSGNISIIHHVLFGLRFTESGLRFEPFVPATLADKRSLTNFKYRNAVLNIEMQGSGNHIRSFMLDGKELPGARIPVNLKGVHSVKIILDGVLPERQTIAKVTNYVSTAAPIAKYENGVLSWSKVERAVKYRVLKNGKQFSLVTTEQTAIKEDSFAEYQVVAVDDNTIESFASEPVRVAKPALTRIYEVEEYAGKASFPYQGFSGSGFAEISTAVNQQLAIPLEIEVSGNYVIDWRYANGNGPTNTQNKCAIRTMSIDSKPTGVFVFPQRGNDVWSDWGFSNPVTLYLTKGKHMLKLSYLPENRNMNEGINQAMIDYLRIVKH